MDSATANSTNIRSTIFSNFAPLTTATALAFVMGAYENYDVANNGNACDSILYETIVFRYALTDQAIYQIEGYLAWKWGLNASLPTNHPYYRIRP
jgi:hypothetical protein